MGNITDRKKKHKFDRNRYFTPAYIANAARVVMGKIDLDPASEELANATIKARKFYTKETNGLLHPWHGNIWLNPPYSAALMKAFIAKLKVEIELGHTKKACAITNNSTETNWAQTLFSTMHICCMLSARVQFYNPEVAELIAQGLIEKKPGNFAGQIVWYNDASVEGCALFAEVFKKYGSIITLPASIGNPYASPDINKQTKLFRV